MACLSTPGPQEEEGETKVRGCLLCPMSGLHKEERNEKGRTKTRHAQKYIERKAIFMSQDARLTPAELAAKKAKQAEVGPGVLQFNSSHGFAI